MSQLQTIEWHKPSDKLPKDGEDVLIWYMDDDRIEFARGYYLETHRDKGGGYNWTSTPNRFSYLVLAWAEIVEPEFLVDTADARHRSGPLYLVLNHEPVADRGFKA